MKTFNDLVFEDHPIAKFYPGSKWATMNFDNGYGISVIFGKMFYSNGIDTYEAAVLYEGDLTYSTEITDDVKGHLSAEEITDMMAQIQNL